MTSRICTVIRKLSVEFNYIFNAKEVVFLVNLDEWSRFYIWTNYKFTVMKDLKFLHEPYIDRFS